ncbi:hypothetical protein ACFFOS_28030 [Nocardioides kongjuensis]|uniref:Uncharacterized protein n=1 Tax=Nocardioides kongjuensis TaxID=349522 RepID=A0A852R8M3_9ACTN|nr:hypothetical protein [Nocardioides kongjuensis]NYD31243.1 hypothetical protein [Nocardioides kongjuensis]
MRVETYQNNGDSRNTTQENKLRLTKAQIIELQANGLVAAPDEWFYHPSGSFALAPYVFPGTGRRGKPRPRVTLAPVLTDRDD